MPRAVITGVTGQDGFYLSELLLNKGYEVWGVVRYSARPVKVNPNINVIYGDIIDPKIKDRIKEIKPDEIYNLAAMSHVGESFKIPSYTLQVNTLGTVNLLEVAKDLHCKFYQASTSELFGSTPPPQNELTKFHPRSPYAVSKLAAHYMTINYREAYGLQACTGILFNHESPKRGDNFVTQKVCKGVAGIIKGTQDSIKLGNLDAIRDWGHAKDYVKGMWLIMQHEPDDYVLATGQGRTIHDLVNTAFSLAGIEPSIEIDQDLIRPSEVNSLIGDPTKAEGIGWERTYTFREMIKEMLEAAL